MNPDNFAAQQLVEKIIAAFPDDSAVVDARVQSQGFEPKDAPYIWIEQFSQLTTDALKAGDTTKARSHLQLISGLLDSPDGASANCVDVAYVEPLMWNMSEEEKKQGWLAIPQNLRNLYVAMWGKRPFMEHPG